MSGAVLNALNTRLDAGTIRFVLEHAETKVLIADRMFSHLIVEAVARAKDLELSPVQEFGDGQSHIRFREVLKDPEVWRGSLQKYFRDVPLAALDVVP